MDPKHQFAAQYVLSRAANERREREALLAAAAMNMTHFTSPLLGGSAGLNNPSPHSETSTPADMKMERNPFGGQHHGGAAAAGSAATGHLDYGLNARQSAMENNLAFSAASLCNQINSTSSITQSGASMDQQHQSQQQQQVQHHQQQQLLHQQQQQQVQQQQVQQPPQPQQQQQHHQDLISKPGMHAERSEIRSPSSGGLMENVPSSENNSQAMLSPNEDIRKQQQTEEENSRYNAAKTHRSSDLESSGGTTTAELGKESTAGFETSGISSDTQAGVDVASSQLHDARASPIRSSTASDTEHGNFKQSMNNFGSAAAAAAGGGGAASGGGGVADPYSGSSSGGYSDLLNRYRLEQTIKHLHGFQDPRTLGLPFPGGNQQS